jgi:hypothetical protein
MGLNFLKKNDSDHEKIFGATKWSQRLIIIDFLLLLYWSRYKNSKNPYLFQHSVDIFSSGIWTKFINN